MSTQASVFNSFEWLESWTSTYWQDNYRLRVLLITDKRDDPDIEESNKDSNLVAIVPLYFNPERKGYFLLGSGEPELSEVSTEYMDIPVSNKAANLDDLYRFIARQLQELIPGKLTVLNCVPGSHLWEISANLKHVIKRETGREYKLRLTDSDDEIFNTFSRNQKKKSKLLTNRFQKNNELGFAVEEGDAFEVNWNILRALHQADWEARGKPGAMASIEFNAFHKHLKLTYPNIRQLFTILRSGSDVIAINFYYVWEDTVYFYLSGSLKQGYDRLSPGNMLHTLSISEFTSRFGYYDFLKGGLNDSYKGGFCSPGKYFYTLDVYGNSMTAILKCYVAKMKIRIRKLMG